MKSISAAIVVLAGAIIFASGSFNQHGDTQGMVCAVGGIVALIGMWRWWQAMDRPE
jgi:hypothetical protein